MIVAAPRVNRLSGVAGLSSTAHLVIGIAPTREAFNGRLPSEQGVTFGLGTSSKTPGNGPTPDAATQCQSEEKNVYNSILRVSVKTAGNPAYAI